MASPRDLFDDAWRRCDMLSVMYAYLSSTTTKALHSEEILRAEWVARVAALDLYVHELVSQRMVEIFDGRRAATDAYMKFLLPNETLQRIRVAPTADDAISAFDLEVRRQLSFVTYQSHESIANGIRMVSSVELWNGVAAHLGYPPATVAKKAKALRGQLSMIVERRNKIAHEGDMQPSAPRLPWPISQADMQTVSSFILEIVGAIDAIA
jgi:hypothetical protein